MFFPYPWFIAPSNGRSPPAVFQQITSDQLVIQAVRGYKLELISAPYQEIPTKASGSQGPLLHGSRDSEAHEQGCGEEGHLLCKSVPQPNFSGSPKKDGATRLVINLRPLNWIIQPVHFKMESLGMIRDLLREGDWMASIDLKDAYLSVTIWPLQVSKVSTAGQLVRVSVPSIRPEQCTSCLHQATEACPCKTSSGYEVNNVPGRYAGDGQEQNETGVT